MGGCPGAAVGRPGRGGQVGAQAPSQGEAPAAAPAKRKMNERRGYTIVGRRGAAREQKGSQGRAALCIESSVVFHLVTSPLLGSFSCACEQDR